MSHWRTRFLMMAMLLVGVVSLLVNAPPTLATAPSDTVGANNCPNASLPCPSAPVVATHQIPLTHLAPMAIPFTPQLVTTTAAPTNNVTSPLQGAHFTRAFATTCTSIMCISQLYMSDPTTITVTWNPYPGANKYILRWWTEGNDQQASQQDFGGDVSAVAVRNVLPGTKYIFEVEGVIQATTCLFACVASYTGWSDQVYLITSGPIGSVEIASVSWGSGRVDIIVRGPQNNYLHTYWNGTWHSFESLGGTFISDPAIASWAPGRLDVFGIGADNAMWHAWYNGSGWYGWERLGGAFTSKPAAVSWGANRIDIFGRGFDNAIWHGWWDGASWHLWESLGGYFASAPSASSWGVNRLDVFGRGGDNAIWHGWWDGASWHLWESLGGAFNSAPAAISTGNHIDVFGRGFDNAIWHGWWDGASWHLWVSLGGPFAGGPAVSSGYAAYTVFAIDTGGLLRDISPGEGSWGYIGTAHFVSDTHI